MERFSIHWCTRTLGTVALCSLTLGQIANRSYAQSASDVVFVSDDQSQEKVPPAPKAIGNSSQAKSELRLSQGQMPRPFRTIAPRPQANPPREAMLQSRSMRIPQTAQPETSRPKRKGLLTRFFGSNESDSPAPAPSSLSMRDSGRRQQAPSGNSKSKRSQIAVRQQPSSDQQRPSLWSRLTSGVTGTENDPSFSTPSTDRAGRPRRSPSTLALRPARKPAEQNRGAIVAVAKGEATANRKQPRVVPAIADGSEESEVRIASAHQQRMTATATDRNEGTKKQPAATKRRDKVRSGGLLSLLGSRNNSAAKSPREQRPNRMAKSPSSKTRQQNSRSQTASDVKSPSAPALQLKSPSNRQVASRPSTSAATPRMSPTGEGSRAMRMSRRTAGPALREIPARKPAKLTINEPIKQAEPQLLSGTSAHAARIIAEAHTVSQQASTKEEYTHIIQTCRRALAVDATGTVGQYARDLAAWALNRRGQLKADQRQDVEALLDFEDALAMKPDLWRAVHNRGVLLAQQGKFEQAFDDFNRTTELNPEFAKAYSNRATLFVQAGDLTAALQDYKKAIEADPDLAVAHKGRGRICHMLGELEAARAHYDAAAQLAPEDVHILISRADLLADIGRYTDAVRQYEDAIAVDPTAMAACRSAAWLLATCPDDRIRDGERALRLIEQCLDSEGEDDSLTLDTLAAAQAAAGSFAEAIATQQRAVDMASAGEREAYAHRLALYQENESFLTQPLQPIRKVNYQQ